MTTACVSPDNALFRIFDFEWIQGDPATALSEPNTVVITETTARKYFANENPLGQILELETARWPMEVVGVIGDLRTIPTSTSTCWRRSIWA